MAPVRVRKLDTDGTRTIVVPAEGETLDPGMELVTGVLAVSSDDEAAPGGSNNPFAFKRPERRQRSAGGVEAKPGQNQGGGRPPHM